MQNQNKKIINNSFLSLNRRRFTLSLLTYFWIIILGYLITQGIIQYYIILGVWGHNDIITFMSSFLFHNIIFALIFGMIQSIAIFVIWDKPERFIAELEKNNHGHLDVTRPLFDCLYNRQKILPYVFLSFGFCHSVAIMADWMHNSFIGDIDLWVIRINSLLMNLSLSFIAYRLFNLAVIHLCGNLVRKFEITLMGNHKPYNTNYDFLIISISMGAFCIFLSLYIYNLTSFQGDFLIERFLNILNLLQIKGICPDNYLIVSIMKHEMAQQAISMIGVNPYMTLNEADSLSVFRGLSVDMASFFIVIFYIIFIFMMYFFISVDSAQRIVRYLSSYLRGVLQGVTSLKNSMPLMRFNSLGYMMGYLNLLFQHIYRMIMNLMDSIVQLAEISEKSTTDADNGTNEVYNVTHSFASVNLKADLQLQSIRGIREAFNDLRQIIKSIDNEVSIQKEQLETAKATVSGVKTAIVEMEQSSKNVAKLFEKLNNLAGSGLDIVQNAYSVVSDISQTSYNVRDIVSSIEKLSGQTGLLAMSASIESAHAGSHGLGFSVVAQSVRKLSDDSGTQSKAIRTQIEEMVQKVEVEVSLSRHVSRSFQSIASSTQNSANLFHHIYNSIDEQNKQSATINTEIEDLLATTQEILNFTQEQVQILDELNQTTVQMEQDILNISKSSQWQSNMSEEIISLFESLNNHVVLNIERVHSINEKIKRFKLD